MSLIVSPRGHVISWGALVAASGRFLYLGGLENAAASASENLTFLYLPRGGLLRNLSIIAGASTTVTARLNLTNTALTVTGATNTFNMDQTHGIYVPDPTPAAPQILTMAVSGTAGADCRVTLEFV